MLVVPTGGSFRLANPNMWTQIVDPIGLEKSFKKSKFFRFHSRWMLFCATLSTKNYSIMGQCMGQVVDPCFWELYFYAKS